MATERMWGMEMVQEFVEEAVVLMFRGWMPEVYVRRMARLVASAVGVRFSEYTLVDKECEVL